MKQSNKQKEKYPMITQSRKIEMKQELTVNKQKKGTFMSRLE